MDVMSSLPLGVHGRMPQPPVSIDIQVKDMEKVQEAMTEIVKDLSGSPMRGGMAKATLVVVRSARKNAPVDTGVLRASIVPEVMTLNKQIVGVVGSNVKYSAYQEFGTRAFTPPIAPLWRWAMRKTKGKFLQATRLFLKAMASIRGRGIIPKRYLQRAFEDNAERIFKIIGDVVSGIVNKG